MKDEGEDKSEYDEYGEDRMDEAGWNGGKEWRKRLVEWVDEKMEMRRWR